MKKTSSAKTEAWNWKKRYVAEQKKMALALKGDEHMLVVAQLLHVRAEETLGRKNVYRYYYFEKDKQGEIWLVVASRESDTHFTAKEILDWYGLTWESILNLTKQSKK